MGLLQGPPVGIIGAGITGTAIARLLALQGHHVRLFEPPTTPENSARHDYGITLYPHMYRPLLKKLNVDEQEFKARVAVTTPVRASSPGAILPEKLVKDSKLSIEGSFQAHQRRLIDFLSSGSKPDIEMSYLDSKGRIEREPRVLITKIQTTGHLRDGLHSAWPAVFSEINPKGEEFRLLIAADGAHSMARQSMGFKLLREQTNFVQVRGKYLDSRWREDYRDGFGASNVVEMRSGNTLLHTEVNKLQTLRGQHCAEIAWTYSRPKIANDPLYFLNYSTRHAFEERHWEFFRNELIKLGKLPPPFDIIFNIQRMAQYPMNTDLLQHTHIPLRSLQEAAKDNIYFVGDAARSQPLIGGHGANAALLRAVSFAEHVEKFGFDALPRWYNTTFERQQHARKVIDDRLNALHDVQKATKPKRTNIQGWTKMTPLQRALAKRSKRPKVAAGSHLRAIDHNPVRRVAFGPNGPDDENEARELRREKDQQILRDEEGEQLPFPVSLMDQDRV